MADVTPPTVVAPVDDADDAPADMVKFTWTVPNYSKITEKKIFSEVFQTKTAKWRLLLFPQGNTDTKHLACYVASYEVEKNPPHWSCYAQFYLAIVNGRTPARTNRRDAQHNFTAEESDWGFTTFMKLSEIITPGSGFIDNDTLVIDCELEVSTDVEQANFWNYDSKKETGYVGLRNQGATCYMNSLLQTLHHLPYFRKCVYLLPTEDDDPISSIPLALQRVFYRLQYSSDAVGTTELTKSFGWDTMDSFMQHDVQELNRVLMDNLETKMKGTVVDGTVRKVWEGKTINYIECVNVDYKSTREETFYDISLQVKGLKNIYEAFDAYVRPELLEKDNQYKTEEFGMQDARMGVRFKSFPPVLYVQLKRFEYDFQRDAMCKVNDRFEFPAVLELDNYLTQDADRTFSNTYDLHAVLVHSGDVHGGHYYAFVKPTERPDWFKFDDDRVTATSEKVAINENYGRNPNETLTGNRRWPLSRPSASTSAYMLMYVRRSDQDWALSPVTEDEVPHHIRDRFERERIEEEEQKKERMEAHLYVNVTVSLVADMEKHDGIDLVNFDRMDPNRIYKVLKTMTVAEFKGLVATDLGVPVDRQRWWKWVARQNRTIRPQSMVQESKNDATIVSLFKDPKLSRLFLEVSKVPADAPPETPAFPEHNAENILLFFKHYNPKAPKGTPKMVFAGYQLCDKTMHLPELVIAINRLRGNAETNPLVVMEEIRPTMIEPIEPTKTLAQCELQNGDILCFMDPITPEEEATLELPTIVSYYEYLRNRAMVTFRDISKPHEDGPTIELLKTMEFDAVADAVGKELNFDGEKLRFTGYNHYIDGPKPFALKRKNQLTGVQCTLADMLYSYQVAPRDVLYYEKLDVSLQDLESKIRRTVSWYNAKVEEIVTHSLLIDKKCTVADLLEEFRTLIMPTQAEVKPDTPLRLLEVAQYRITKMFNIRDPVTMISEHAHIRCEAVPPEELDVDLEDRLIFCMNYSKDIFHPFGDPFVLLLKKGDNLASVRARMVARLALPAEEIASWKIAIVSFGRPSYIKEEDTIRPRDIWQTDYIGLDHDDNTPPSKRRKHVTSAVVRPAHRAEHAIKIYN